MHLTTLALALAPVLFPAQAQETPKDDVVPGATLQAGHYLFRQARNAVTNSADALGHPSRWPSLVRMGAVGFTALSAGALVTFGPAYINGEMMLPYTAPLMWPTMITTVHALSGGSAKEVAITAASYSASSAIGAISMEAFARYVGTRHPLVGGALYFGAFFGLGRLFEWGLTELFDGGGKSKSDSTGGVAPQVERLGHSIPD